jgi:hypothetical protein
VGGESRYEQFRATPEQVAEIRKHNVEVRARKRLENARNPQRESAKVFVKGPVDLRVLGRAFQAHSAAPLILLALKRGIDMNKGERSVFAVTTKFCEGLNISTNSRLRAVRALEAEGMITVNWIDKKAPLVRLAKGLFRD